MIYIFSAIILYIFLGLSLYLLQRKILFNTSGRPQDPSYYGLEVVKKIESTTTGNSGGMGDVPVEAVIIENIKAE